MLPLDQKPGHRLAYIRVGPLLACRRSVGLVRQTPVGHDRVLPPGDARREAEHHRFNLNKTNNQAEKTLIHITQITNSGCIYNVLITIAWRCTHGDTLTTSPAPSCPIAFSFHRQRHLVFGDWCRLGSGQAHQQQLWACYTAQVAVEAIACV